MKEKFDTIFPVDPTYERAFLEIFSPKQESTKRHLINFINAIFTEHGFRPIVDLEPFSENLTPDQKTMDSKFARIDVVVTDVDKNIINVEIQRGEQYFFYERSYFNSCRLYGGQLAKKQSYSQLKKVVIINILNFTLFKEKVYKDMYLTTHQMMCVETKTSLKESPVTIFYLELPKLNESQKSSKTKSWAALLSNNKNFERFIMENKESQDAYRQAEKITHNPALIAAYLDYIERLNDDEAIRATERDMALEEGMQKGMQKGMEIGIEKGIEKAKFDVYSKLLNLGHTRDQIVQLFNINEQELEKILQSGKN